MAGGKTGQSQSRRSMHTSEAAFPTRLPRQQIAVTVTHSAAPCLRIHSDPGWRKEIASASITAKLNCYY